jgi:hypothetical protein
MASVKTVSADYIDYVHLAKWNDRNVIWYWKDEPPARQP